MRGVTAGNVGRNKYWPKNAQIQNKKEGLPQPASWGGMAKNLKPICKQNEKHSLNASLNHLVKLCNFSSCWDSPV